MVTKKIEITNSVGLHARPATYFIQEANKYKSAITVKNDMRRVNAKSLLGVLSLGIIQGMTIELEAEGPDEVEAINGLADLVENGLGKE